MQDVEPDGEPRWSVAALVPVSLLVIWLLGSSVWSAISLAERDVVQHGLEDYVIRMGPAREAFEKLWAERGPLGYHHVEDPGQTMSAAQTWVLTQYTLAPAVVLNSTDPEWLVGDYHTPAVLDAVVRRGEPKFVGHFGSGVCLMRNEAAE